MPAALCACAGVIGFPERAGSHHTRISRCRPAAVGTCRNAGARCAAPRNQPLMETPDTAPRASKCPMCPIAYKFARFAFRTVRWGVPRGARALCASHYNYRASNTPQRSITHVKRVARVFVVAAVGQFLGIWDWACDWRVRIYIWYAKGRLRGRAL